MGRRLLRSLTIMQGLVATSSTQRALPTKNADSAEHHHLFLLLHHHHQNEEAVPLPEGWLAVATMTMFAILIVLFRFIYSSGAINPPPSVSNVIYLAIFLHRSSLPGYSRYVACLSLSGRLWIHATT